MAVISLSSVTDVRTASAHRKADTPLCGRGRTQAVHGLYLPGRVRCNSGTHRPGSLGRTNSAGRKPPLLPGLGPISGTTMHAGHGLNPRPSTPVVQTAVLCARHRRSDSFSGRSQRYASFTPRLQPYSTRSSSAASGIWLACASIETPA